MRAMATVDWHDQQCGPPSRQDPCRFHIGGVVADEDSEWDLTVPEDGEFHTWPAR